MLPEAYDVTGKVVLITGAGRGIGKGSDYMTGQTLFLDGGMSL